MKVLIAILNYNGKRLLGNLLDKCILSLLNQSYKNITILFIDNNSDDESCDYIREKYNIEIIELKENLGTIAINKAFEMCLSGAYNYILMSNNDIVYEYDFIEKMIDGFNMFPEAGVLTPRIMFLDKKSIYNSTGIIMNKSGFAWDRDFNKSIDSIGIVKSGEVLFASGGAMFIKSEVLKKIGFFDNIYFAYYEDVDFSMRIRLLTDFKIYYIDNAVCYHKFSASWKKSGKKEFYMMRNRFFFIIKFFPLKLLLNAIRYLIFTSSTNNSIINRKVYYDLMRHIPLLIFKRLRINKKRFPYSMLENYHGYPRL